MKLKSIPVPEDRLLLQHGFHLQPLGGAVAEALQKHQVVEKDAAPQLHKHLVHHKRGHDAQRVELLLCELPRVHALRERERDGGRERERERERFGIWYYSAGTPELQDNPEQFRTSALSISNSFLIDLNYVHGENHSRKSGCF